MPKSAKSEAALTSAKSTEIPMSAKSDMSAKSATIHSISPIISEKIPVTSKSIRSSRSVASVSPSELSIDHNSPQQSPIHQLRHRSLPVSRSPNSIHETPRKSLERETSRPVIIIQATSPTNENFRRTLMEALGDKVNPEDLKLPPIPQASNSSAQQTTSQPLNVTQPVGSQIPQLPPIPNPYNYYPHPYHPPPPSYAIPPYGYHPYGYPHMMPPPPPQPPFMPAPNQYVHQAAMQSETGYGRPSVPIQPTLNGSMQSETTSQVTPQNTESETKPEPPGKPLENKSPTPKPASPKQISPRDENAEPRSKPKKKRKSKRPLRVSVGDRPPSNFYERFPNLPYGRSLEPMDSKPVQDDPSKPSFGSKPPPNFKTENGPSYFDLSSRRHSEPSPQFYGAEQFEESDEDEAIREKLKNKKKRSKKKDKDFEEILKQEYDEMQKEKKRLKEAEAARKAAESPIPFDRDLTKLLTLIATGEEAPSEGTLSPRIELPETRFDKSEDNPIKMESVRKSKTPSDMSERSSDVKEYEQLLAKYDEDEEKAKASSEEDISPRSLSNKVKDILDKNLIEENEKQQSKEQFAKDDINDDFYDDHKRKKKRRKRKDSNQNKKDSKKSLSPEKEEEPENAFSEMLRELTQELNSTRASKNNKHIKTINTGSKTPDTDISEESSRLLASPSDSMIISEIRKHAREQIRKEKERAAALKQGDIAINRLLTQLTKEADEATEQIEHRKKLKSDLNLGYFMNNNNNESDDDPTTPEDIEVYAMKNGFLSNVSKGANAATTPAPAPSRESSTGSGQGLELEKENVHSQVLLAEAQKKILQARNMLQKYSL